MEHTQISYSFFFINDGHENIRVSDIQSIFVPANSNGAFRNWSKMCCTLLCCIQMSPLQIKTNKNICNSSHVCHVWLFSYVFFSMCLCLCIRFLCLLRVYIIFMITIQNWQKHNERTNRKIKTKRVKQTMRATKNKKIQRRQRLGWKNVLTHKEIIIICIYYYYNHSNNNFFFYKVHVESKLIAISVWAWQNRMLFESHHNRVENAPQTTQTHTQTHSRESFMISVVIYYVQSIFQQY